MGSIQAAAGFRDEARIPFPLLVDDDKQSYRALDLKRGSPMQLLGPDVIARGVKSRLRGHRTARPRQDPLQLGGALVVAPGGEATFEHRNRTSADHAPIEAMLESIPTAADNPQSP